MAVIEYGINGRAHLHAVVVTDDPIDAGVLRERTVRAGFARVLDMRPVGASARDRAALCAYVTKELRTTAVALHAAGSARPRPIVFGRSWTSIEG